MFLNAVFQVITVINTAAVKVKQLRKKEAGGSYTLNTVNIDDLLITSASSPNCTTALANLAWSLSSVCVYR